MCEQVTVSSNKAAGMEKKVLVLNLSVEDASGKRRPVMIELTKEELDSVIAQFDKISKVTQSLTV